MTTNIFVLGMDEPNRKLLEALPDAGELTFHPLLSLDELRHRDQIRIDQLLDKAQTQLDGLDGSIDAIIGFWDFPVTQMVPILCRRYGLRSASLESVLKCEHKYWSRLEQQASIDEIPASACSTRRRRPQTCRTTSVRTTAARWCSTARC